MSAKILSVPFNERLDTQEKIHEMTNLVYRLKTNGFGFNISLVEKSEKHPVAPELGLHKLLFEYFLAEFADRFGTTQGIVEVFGCD